MLALMKLFAILTALTWTRSATGDRLSGKPCLPSQLQYNGMDTKRSGEDAKRYDITPERCDVYNIDHNMDLPKCVPEMASRVSSTKHGDAWKFRNVDGATLLYSVLDPSTIFEKISPGRLHQCLTYSQMTLLYSVQYDPSTTFEKISP
ncbi:hypothetical protein PoB_006355500, partial [Plakobranchus ocellatus]